MRQPPNRADSKLPTPVQQLTVAPRIADDPRCHIICIDVFLFILPAWGFDISQRRKA
jgi:hypothetical protein